MKVGCDELKINTINHKEALKDKTRQKDTVKRYNIGDKMELFYDLNPIIHTLNKMV